MEFLLSLRSAKARQRQTKRMSPSCRIGISAWIILLTATLGCSFVKAQEYISAEPIPSVDFVGTANLNKVESLGYQKLALWSDRLLWQCQIVQDVIYTLADNRAIKTINFSNTRFAVAAGGFEGVTDPSYVLTVENSGPHAASASDIFVLDNALGYALNQSGTAQFSLRYDPKNSNEFPLDYALVNFSGPPLTGEHAKQFFNYLGTIDAALWTGSNAGFTQIDLESPWRYNSMLFLIGDVTTQEFINGIYKAAITTPDATYSPLTKHGIPTVGTAGAAFPGNDWIADPDGTGYLTNLGNPSPQLVNDLAALRKKHLVAVTNLLNAIDAGDVDRYLINKFRCP